MELLAIGAGALVTLVLTSLYNLAATTLRRRVTVRSPESAAIKQLVPAVNCLVSIMGPMLTSQKAILEAQKGICNGNVDHAIGMVAEASERYNDFLIGAAKVEEKQ